MKPVKYERTHEENQERSISVLVLNILRTLTFLRAYIAASRRSDRGLEARMESARRASIIHERRTGRALRVTESDVINEEMYEEINDLPTEYRRLNAHLRTQSEDFDRRLLAYLSSQMATRQAVSDCWQNYPSQLNTHGLNPNMPQEPSPQMHPLSGTGFDYRQASYPTVPQNIDSRRHSRTLSAATAYNPGIDQHQSQSQFISPHNNARHMSLDSHPSSLTMQPPWTTPSTFTDPRNLNNIPRTDSAVDMSGSPKYIQQSPQTHANRSNPGYHPWQMNKGDCPEPLSNALPLDTQRLSTSNRQTSHLDGTCHSASSPSHDFTDRRYSYNPNGRPRPVSTSPAQRSGQNSSCPSPLRTNMDHGSRPSSSHGHVLSQVYHDTSGIDSNGILPMGAMTSEKTKLDG
jgi:hypothetical protein